MRPRLAIVTLFLLACGVTGPVALQWDEASCTHCHMTLADRHFGAEVVTKRGRVLPFDDAGCAATHLATGVTPEAEVSSVWVIDFTRPDSLIPAEGAFYVRSGEFHTPMGSGVVATAVRETADSLAQLHQATVMNWREVQILAAHGQLEPR